MTELACHRCRTPGVAPVVQRTGAPDPLRALLHRARRRSQLARGAPPRSAGASGTRRPTAAPVRPDQGELRPDRLLGLRRPRPPALPDVALTRAKRAIGCRLCARRASVVPRCPVPWTVCRREYRATPGIARSPVSAAVLRHLEVPGAAHARRDQASLRRRGPSRRRLDPPVCAGGHLPERHRPGSAAGSAPLPRSRRARPGPLAAASRRQRPPGTGCPAAPPALESAGRGRRPAVRRARRRRAARTTPGAGRPDPRPRTAPRARAVRTGAGP